MSLPSLISKMGDMNKTLAGTKKGQQQHQYICHTHTLPNFSFRYRPATQIKKKHSMCVLQPFTPPFRLALHLCISHPCPPVISLMAQVFFVTPTLVWTFSKMTFPKKRRDKGKKGEETNKKNKDKSDGISIDKMMKPIKRLLVRYTFMARVPPEIDFCAVVSQSENDRVQSAPCVCASPRCLCLCTLFYNMDGLHCSLTSES